MKQQSQYEDRGFAAPGYDVAKVKTGFDTNGILAWHRNSGTLAWLFIRQDKARQSWKYWKNEGRAYVLSLLVVNYID